MPAEEFSKRNALQLGFLPYLIVQKKAVVTKLNMGRAGQKRQRNQLTKRQSSQHKVGYERSWTKAFPTRDVMMWLNFPGHEPGQTDEKPTR